jgi:hypothetical protein
LSTDLIFLSKNCPEYCYLNLGNKQDALYYLQQTVNLFQEEGDRLRYEEAIEAINRVNNSQ